VNIGTLIEDYRGPSINIANEAVVRLSIDHLTALGHRRIVFLVNEPEASGNVMERCRAFNSIVAERELSDARLVSCGTRFWEDSHAKAYETMPAVLAMNPRPTAIFTHSDAGAWAALRWLAEHDIKCPGQISVLGFSDDAPSRFTYPKLTTFAQPTLEMTARAIEMLTEKPMPRRIERFLPVLVQRESTGPAITE
jgi:DNA-binding LacI/PurR family transcriptional regulator